MKLRNLIKVLHPKTVVCLMDDDNLYLVVEIKDIPKELKKRKVRTLHGSSYDGQYDLFIFLNIFLKV